MQQPDDFSHYQNYPNPFNPNTTIKFSLSQLGFANLSIYTSLGQLVKQLTRGKLNSGTHSMSWISADDSGQKVSSGFYFLMLQTFEGLQIKKMKLTK
ncbi:MAG: FlgD immunoglobulin-like domain containing protein [Calditrichia bacterium]